MDEVMALRTLATRLLAQHYLYDLNTQSLRILIGTLPDNLPVAIPVPEGSDVIGSVSGDPRQSASMRYPLQTHILFDTGLSPEEVRDFYRVRLQAAGWTMPFYPLRPGAGFTYGEPPHADAVRELFCYSTRGPALWVNAHKMDGLTSVLLEVDMRSRQSSCGAHRAEGATPRREASRIPPLLQPADGTFLPMWGSGTSGGPGMGYSSAAVETALDLPALATHYTSQLEKVGWIRRDGGQDGVLAWSTWTFRDETGDSWEGVLYITRRPDRPNQYILQVRAECVE